MVSLDGGSSSLENRGDLKRGIGVEYSTGGFIAMRITRWALASVAVLAVAGTFLTKNYPCPLCWPIIGKFLG
jgi:hypothetical protein